MTGKRGIFRRVLKSGDVVFGIDLTDPMTHKRYRHLVGPNRRLAERALDARRAAIAAGKFGVRMARAPITLQQFVDETWRPQVLALRKPSTQRGYEWMLRHHVLPAFGGTLLMAITKPAIKAFIARKAQEQHQSRNKMKPPNPDRAKLAPKTVVNLVSMLGSILASAADDYDLIPSNPAAGLLRRRNIPAEMRPRDRRPHVLEPEDFRRSVEAVADVRVRRMVLFAALTGLRWGELVAVRWSTKSTFVPINSTLPVPSIGAPHRLRSPSRPSATWICPRSSAEYSRPCRGRKGSCSLRTGCSASGKDRGSSDSGTKRSSRRA